MKSFTTKLNGSEFKIMRLNDALTLNRPNLDTPEIAVNYLTEKLPSSLRYNQDTENFIVVLLNTRRAPIGFEVISNGTLDTLLVHPREVFYPAVRYKAHSLIIVHNHPSGDPSPSPADLELTRVLLHSSRVMGIGLDDHVIIGNGSFISLKERGYMGDGPKY